MTKLPKLKAFMAGLEPAPMHRQHLTAFVAESNRIEGMPKARPQDIQAHETLLALDAVTLDDLQAFVAAIGGGPLRDQPGMNVRVGPHVPAPGGPGIRDGLESWLKRINRNDGDPWALHVEYETLHPFMDGNGRSGRAMWAWQILTFQRWPASLALGFLHPNYYAALQAGRR